MQADMNSWDLFKIEEDRSPKEKNLISTLRPRLEKEILPFVGEWYEKGHFPVEAVKLFGELGLFGPTIAVANDTVQDYRGYGLMMREIERLDSGLRSLASVQGALVMYPLSLWASESVREKWLLPLRRGEKLGCFGLTEPLHGSNPANIETVYRETADGFILNGHKRWLTNGLLADVAIVWAASEIAGGPIRGFVLEKNFKGVEFSEIPHKWSLRVSISAELRLRDVHVPKENVLNVTGLKGPFTCLNLARFGIAWGVLGAAEYCFTEALGYLKGRSQFGAPLASHQLIQAKLVEMASAINLGLMTAERVATLFNENRVRPEQISFAKMHNVSQALKTARTARDLLGANGILYTHHCGRHMMNLETVNTYEGTEDIHRMIVGQALTGIAAFKA